MASICAIFTSTYHIKQLNPWPNSSASPVVNYSRLFACHGEMEPFEDHLSTHECLKSIRNKPQQQQPTFNTNSYLSELLVNTYTNCLVVKSVPCYCVCGKRVFSNPVTYHGHILCQVKLVLRWILWMKIYSKAFAIPILTASRLILTVAIAIRRGIANALEFILIL